MSVSVQKFGTLEATLGSNGDQRRERGPIKGKLTKPVASNGSVTRSNSAAAPLKVQLVKSCGQKLRQGNANILTVGS